MSFIQRWILVDKKTNTKVMNILNMRLMMMMTFWKSFLYPNYRNQMKISRLPRLELCSEIRSWQKSCKLSLSCVSTRGQQRWAGIIALMKSAIIPRHYREFWIKTLEPGPRIVRDIKTYPNTDSSTRSKGSVNLPQGSVNLVVFCKVY